jgi:hypothetical protein
MKKLAILLGLVLALAGCQGPEPEKPVWQDIKFKELAIAKHSSPAQNPLQPPFQLNVYIFDVPIGNFDIVRACWDNLDRKQIRFKNEEIFSQNGFLAAMGSTSVWPKVAEKLHQADSKTLKSVDLIMANNDTERIPVSQIDAEKSIFYKTLNGQISGATVGPGKAMLRLTASTISDMRGVCRLTIEPAFTSTIRSGISAGAPEEIIFDSMPFTARISQGDFILLGPAITAQEMALGSLFFETPDKTTVQIYLIFCVKVNN